MQSLRTLSLINKIIGITALNDKIMQTSESYFSCQSIFLYILWSYSFHNCLVTNVATLLNNKCCRECHVWRWNHVWKFLYNIRNNNINSSYLIMKKKKKHCVMLKNWLGDKNMRIRDYCDEDFQKLLYSSPRK